MTESPTHPPAVRPVAAFIVLMSVADAWLVAWWIGSVWVMAVAAGILSGLFVVIALTIRRDLPAISVGVLITAVALTIVLARSSLSPHSSER